MYSAEEFLKKKSIEIKKINLEENSSQASYEKLKEFDKMKSKVLKYALYKKRTEQEIRQKFEKELEENMLNDIIEVLKQNSYIDDNNYIDKTVNEYIKLKKLSIKEVKYKLLAKGIRSSLIDDYVSNNIDELNEYELQSATRIANKKRETMEDDDIRMYLMKKGYKSENIKQALSSSNE